MPNLYVFDKDHTLVHPRKDGYISSPEDQVLYEGVRAKLDRLRSKGHVLAIASNQGGCDVFDYPVRLLKDGMIWHNPPFMDAVFKIERTFDLVETDEVSIYVRRAINPPNSVMGIVVKSDFICKVSHKTIEGAIAEMQFAADLCGIREAYFAPTMDGKSIVSLNRSDSKWWHQIETPSPESNNSFGDTIFSKDFFFLIYAITTYIKNLKFINSKIVTMI